jgi:mono/diheme cytochrome c family protein
MPEAGGWTPSVIQATQGKPLHLRLLSDDVVHGFAIGGAAAADNWPSLELLPGKVVETVLTFNKPGTYTFYCTRWCGLNHWRMRGTIVVSPAHYPTREPASAQPPPLYVQLGLDIDAPHIAPVVPSRRPSAGRGAALDIQLPASFFSKDYYRSKSPAQTWQELRLLPVTRSISDEQVWDLVAGLWQSNATPEALSEGRQLYAANCAACHGEKGAGDGVFAHQPDQPDAMHTVPTSEHGMQPPASFNDAGKMLGASPALLQGKIVRGGMGTGMPYWGSIFTEDQLWALVSYLWTFQFDLEMETRK